MQLHQPELELSKAHDVRKLEGCKCGGLGRRDQSMVNIDGQWWHGRCAIAEFGIDRIAALPRDATANLRLSDIGPAAMKKLINR